MLLSHRHRFIYTKTFKTASTSVESYFEPYCLPDGEWEQTENRSLYEGETGIIGQRKPGAHQMGLPWYAHMPAQKIRDQLGPETWQNYFKFCVVRNPYAYLVSAFYYYNHDAIQGYKPRFWNKLSRTVRQKSGVFDTWGRATEQELFRRWLRTEHYPTQQERYVIEGKAALDYYIRYEDLQAGIEEVCRHLGVPFEVSRLPAFKSGLRPRRSIASYYDRAAIAFVENKFSFDLETFGYAFPTE